MKTALVVTLLFVGTAAFALAGQEVPEIDPASGASALALIAAGLVTIRGRKR